MSENLSPGTKVRYWEPGQGWMEGFVLERVTSETVDNIIVKWRISQRYGTGIWIHDRREIQLLSPSTNNVV